MTSTPASAPTLDYSRFVQTDEGGRHSLSVAVDGMRCTSCAWRIETALNAEADVEGRVNFAGHRLAVSWRGDAARGNALLAKVVELGFPVTLGSGAGAEKAADDRLKFLLRCIATSGFAAANLMLFSLALWFADDSEMTPATRDLLHWLSALVALPACAYAGLPFYKSAIAALVRGRTNMDVPISVGVVLSLGMSLFETVRHGPYVYFDSAVMLLFFLLVGRYLDQRARGHVRSAAEDLLQRLEGTATVLTDGGASVLLIRELRAGMLVSTAVGEKIAADGVIETGVTEIDTSLLTGETLPVAAGVGARVYAGSINLSAPVTVRVSQATDKSLLADIVRLMENAEQRKDRYVRLADRVAALYTPVVHILALAAFLGWVLLGGMVWQEALMIATTVLIITCPCALGLAVPAVQVVAVGRLMRRGVLVKSGDALEKLQGIDTVVFDKTGTLTIGQPMLLPGQNFPDDALRLAASLATHSRHPLSQAIVAGAGAGTILPLTVTEHPGQGLAALLADGTPVRLGKRDWCGDAAADTVPGALELWLDVAGKPPVRFLLQDRLREDAAQTVGALQKAGMRVLLLSGDRQAVVADIAGQLGITDHFAGMLPADKNAMILKLQGDGHKVLMVGDGLNDAPSLLSANVSISPSSGVDITQNAADIVFQGKMLAPVLDAIKIANAAHRLVRQNFVLSMLYNIIAVPLAVAGWVTPLVAAIAMSSSSVVVVVNALRLNRVK
jgi:P-type Cu2+ transporter